jgi:S1-C subfamily serine protease
MGTGGLLLEELPAEERTRAKVANGMALRVKHVGQFGPHAAAKNAGFRQGDIIVRFAGRTDLLRDSDLIAYAVNQHKAGERVAVTVLRDGQSIELMLPMQE